MKKQFYLGLIVFMSVSGFSIPGFAQPVFNKVLGSFTGVSNSQSAWVDFDNDNDLDLIYTGLTKTYVPSTFVYENDNGVFTLRATTLPAINWGSFAVGDYDKDGDSDILITGSTSFSTDDRISAIFRNEGGFVFTEQYSFQGLAEASADWLDIDNDEDLDFIITGFSENNFNSYTTLVYENTGSGFVKLTGTGLPDCSS